MCKKPFFVLLFIFINVINVFGFYDWSWTRFPSNNEIQTALIEYKKAVKEIGNQYSHWETLNSKHNISEIFKIHTITEGKAAYRSRMFFIDKFSYTQLISGYWAGNHIRFNIVYLLYDKESNQFFFQGDEIQSFNNTDNKGGSLTPMRKNHFLVNDKNMSPQLILNTIKKKLDYLNKSGLNLNFYQTGIYGESNFEYKQGWAIEEKLTSNDGLKSKEKCNEFKCSSCGYENPQWVEEDKDHQVLYCKNCGAFKGRLWECYDNKESNTQSETDNTKSSDNASNFPTSNDPDIPWTIIIGALGAGVVASIIAMLKKKAAAAAASRAATAQTAAVSQSSNSQNNQQENNEDKPEEAHYILQLSEDKFNLKLQEPALLTIRVWKVTTAGKSPSSANIEILCSEKALHLSSMRGSGSLTTQLNLKDQPLNPTFNIMVAASANGKTIRQSITINTVGEKEIVVETNPLEKTLRAGIYKTISIYAKVIDEAGNDLPAETEKLKFTPRSNWIELSESIIDDNFHAIALGVSNPNPLAFNPKVPESVALSIVLDEVEPNEKILSKDVIINLLDCKLITEKSKIDFSLSDVNIEETLKVHIENHPGDIPWKFSAEYQRAKSSISPLTNIEIIQEDDYSATIKLKDLLKTPKENEHYIREDLVIFAAQEDEKPLERKVEICIWRTGLTLINGFDNNNILSFTAEDSIQKDFSIVVYSELQESGEVEIDKERMANANFELLSDDEKSVNLASVLKPEFESKGDGGWYVLSTAEGVPGSGDYFSLLYKVSVPTQEGEDAKDFERTIELKVRTHFPGLENPEWEEACRQIEHILNNFVPKKFEGYQKLLNIYNEQRNFLGTEGLIEMRNRIWGIAQNLILAEGAEGYKSVDRWASRIVTTLEWTQWAGDIAFSALMTYKAPKYTMAANLTKGLLIDAINFKIYHGDKPISVFIEEQTAKLWSIIKSSIKGRVISVNNIKYLLGVKNQSLAYAIYTACNFCYNLYQYESIYEAIKITAQGVSEEAMVKFLVGEMQKDAYKHNRTIVDVHEALEDVVKNIEGEIEGQEFINEKKLLEIMRDPAMSRTIKDHAPPFLKKVFNNSKQKIYTAHDKKLIERVAKKYKLNTKDLCIDDFRTPGSDAEAVNTDRDFRMLRKITTPDGQVFGLEISTSNWKKMSNEVFAEITNKPSGIDAKTWAETHKQTPTDRFHEEASLDYSDHRFDGKTGTWVNTTQNIERVKNGESVLYDPKGLGEMYKNKVKAENIASEKIAQTKKAIETLKKVNDSYKKRGGGKAFTKTLEKAMGIIKEAPTDVTATPEAINTINEQLKNLNFDSIESLVGRVSDEISNLPTPKL